MLGRSRWILAAVALATLVGSARPLRAAQLDWEGSLTIKLLGSPTVSTAVGVSTVSGGVGLPELTRLMLPGGTHSTSTSTPFTGPTGTGKLEFSFANGPGDFSAGSVGGVLGGVMPVPGMLRVCVFDPNCALFPITIPFTQNGTRGAGIGGSAFTANNGLVTVTVQGAGWTTGVVTLATASGTSMTAGFVHGPLSGTDLASVGQLSGVLQLVTPLQVTVQPGPQDFAVFGIVQLRFVPEPSALLGLGCGVVALLGMGWVRRR